MKIGLISLGCDKNRVDSEIVLAKLHDAGHSITNNMADADVIIVNTCAFIEAARKESIDTILQSAAYKTEGKRLIVTGCLGQYCGDELNKYLTEADCIIGCDYSNIVHTVEQCFNNCQRLYVPPTALRSIDEGKRILTTPNHYAYIRIADGCDNFCSYCSIPYIRGRFRSRTMESIVEEVRQLAQKGTKEIILVAQDVTRYGLDIYGNYKLVSLLGSLCTVNGIEIIRLLYCYPELVTDDLLEIIQKQPKIAKYIDIPLQHVSQTILRSMGRRGTREQILLLFDKLTEHYPEIALRSTFICGFPGETEQNFEELKEFLVTYKLDNVGFFAYSREKNTRAYTLPNQIPSATKKARVKKLYKVQSDISLANNTKKIGDVCRVIVDEHISNNLYLCRTDAQSPSIDGVTFCTCTQPLNNGDIVNVRITNYENYDLYGEVL